MHESYLEDETRWLLPEGVDEFMPHQAVRLENLRRELIDLFRAWGYDLIIPPLIEYLESLLVGAGYDLELETFKLIDQLSGRLMGIRADMTPQAARIDAHRLQNETPVRLCYIDTVLHTRHEGLQRTRNPLQIGAELYGHAGIESDMEILHLMVEMLRTAGLEDIHIDLGHMMIFRALAKDAQLSPSQETTLFNALQRKAKPEIESFFSEWGLDQDKRRSLISLADLNGDEQVLDEARAILKNACRDVHAALDDLQRISEYARQRLAPIPLHFDLAELRGYRYQTGLVFAAFVPAYGGEIARGGRYDDIGRAFGRARPATGFSSDLKTLMALTPPESEPPHAIMAPWSADRQLRQVVERLRKQGERVIFVLPGQSGEMSEMGCDRMIEKRDGTWQTVDLAETRRDQEP